MSVLSQNRMFKGVQNVYEHRSDACDCTMKVAAYVPDNVIDAPALIWLSGLTCTEQNFVTKAGAQRIASELGVVLIAPDTSPRGEHVPDAEGQYDFGKGAGFYLDATQKPWADNFKTESYIRDELVDWISKNLPVDMNRVGIFGHSMGGHGAMTLHLKNPALFKTCSAFSPIVAPSQVPWGQKAFKGYLGEDEASWKAYDATQLVMQSPSNAHILIDQGRDDEFLSTQLQTHVFKDAAKAVDQKTTIRMQDGFDHSYYFIASFIEDHIRHHFNGL